MIIKAVIPCMRFEVDPETETRNLIGLYNMVNSETFPCTVPLRLYIRLTEHRGPLELRVRIVNLANGEPIGQATVTGPEIPDPVFEYDFSVALPSVSFPEPGRYEIQVVGPGGAIGLTKLGVQPRPDQQPRLE